MPDAIDDTLYLLRRLIRHDSVSRNSNLALIEDIADYLGGIGVVASVLKDATGGKANLLATIGPAGPGGILLAGHSDVVPVDGQQWASDPFDATTRDGRVFGRGACDMKGFIAVTLALAPALAQAGLKRPVHLAFTYDEEIGCFGAMALSEIIGRMDHPPARCIVGEPTSMRVVSGHKGKLSLDCAVHGAEGHSAHNDRGVNAVEIAAELIVRLRTMQRRLAQEGPRDDRFDPPHTTIHTGIVTGGVARNIVPRDCRFEVEIRHLPGSDPTELLREIESFAAQDLLGEMRRVAPDTGIDFALQSNIPALSPDEDRDMIREALVLSESNRSTVVSFATEAGLYQRLGIETIVCGPGDIAQAHRPDEFVAIDQLGTCASFLRAMIGRQQDRAL